jgi:hypothetical protein
MAKDTIADGSVLGRWEPSIGGTFSRKMGDDIDEISKRSTSVQKGVADTRRKGKGTSLDGEQGGPSAAIGSSSKKPTSAVVDDGMRVYTGVGIKLREKTFVGDMKLDVRHSRGVDMNLYYRHSRGVPAVEENEEHDAHADDHREGDVQGGRRSVGRICVGGYGEVAGESGIKQ